LQLELELLISVVGFDNVGGEGQRAGKSENGCDSSPTHDAQCRPARMVLRLELDLELELPSTATLSPHLSGLICIFNLDSLV